MSSGVYPQAALFIYALPFNDAAIMQPQGHGSATSLHRVIYVKSGAKSLRSTPHRGTRAGMFVSFTDALKMYMFSHPF